MLSGPRKTVQFIGNDHVYPVAAGAVIHQGAQVVLDGGYLKPGAEAAGLVAVGRAEESVDNSAGASGAEKARCRRGTFAWKNSATDPVGQANVGKPAYIVDDETVAATDGGGTRSPAGTIINLDGADAVLVAV